MIPNHVIQEVIIVSDGSLIYSLKSNEHEALESSQIVIDFLSSKNENKSAVMIPKIYRELIERARKTKNKELERYLESFCCEARIGVSDKNPDYVEYKTVLEYLLYSHNGMIFFITSDKDCLEMAKEFKHAKLLCGDVNEVKRFIFSNDQNFYDRIFKQYYDSSSV